MPDIPIYLPIAIFAAFIVLYTIVRRHRQQKEQPTQEMLDSLAADVRYEYDRAERYKRKCQSLRRELRAFRRQAESEAGAEPAKKISNTMSS